MQLGAFSISLSVKDLALSRAFYEKLGFTTLGGNADQGWLILKNGSTVIGLFQGMFPKNMLTFNPGWSPEATNIDPFTDVRALEAQLREAEVEILTTNTANSPAGPAHIVLVDPDGNPILIDQHR